MNARTLLIPRTLLILSLVVLSGAPCASAQSFKERLKNAAKKIEQKVKQEVAPKKLPEKSGNTSSLDSELQKRHDAMVGPDNNKNAEDEAPTVRLPETHTALFAPLGYPVEATYGISVCLRYVRLGALSAPVRGYDHRPTVGVRRVIEVVLHARGQYGHRTY